MSQVFNGIYRQVCDWCELEVVGPYVLEGYQVGHGRLGKRCGCQRIVDEKLKQYHAAVAQTEQDSSKVTVGGSIPSSSAKPREWSLEDYGGIQTATEAEREGDTQ